MGRDALDDVKIAAPCSSSWDEMRGDDRVRFCRSCFLNVYDLSAMSRADARNFLYTQEGRVCVRVYRRADGKVLSADCPVGAAALKRRAADLALALVTGFLFVSSAAFAMLSEGGRGLLRTSGLPGAGLWDHAVRRCEVRLLGTWPLSVLTRWLETPRGSLLPSTWGEPEGGHFMGMLGLPDGMEEAPAQTPGVDRILIKPAKRSG